jgi:hypothetical protein
MGPVRGKEGDSWALCGVRKETERSGVRQRRYVWALFDLLKKTDGPHVSQRRPAGHVSAIRNTICWALLES